jgi:hypothetical protein
MFWALLGFSAGIAGVFYLLATGFLFDRPVYEDHRWLFVIGLGVAGVLAWAIGCRRARGTAGQADAGGAGSTSDGATEEPPEPRSSMSLLSLQYWGAMLLVMSLFLGFSCVLRSPARRVAQPAPPMQARKARPVEVPVAAAMPPLKVQGLFYREGTPTVLINDDACGVGDKVSGVTILSITRDALTVEYAGATGTLAMP